MGLLDDAIREHLELKRLRGADPAEVAREQREALEPASDAAGPQAGQPPPDASDHAHTAGEAAPVAAARAEHGHASPDAAHDSDATMRSQETAELDMQSELEGHSHEGRERMTDEDPQGDGPVGGHSELDRDDEAPPEREVPRDPQ